MRCFSLSLAAAFLALALGPALAADDGLSAAANSTFLATYAKKPGVILRPDGLEYRVLHSGFGRRVGPDDIARIYYSAQLINGKVIDGTSPGLPVSLTVNGLIRGLSDALQLMHEGDRWQVLIPPNLGFGVRSGNAIPPGQALLFELTVLSTIPASQVSADTAAASISTFNREGGTSRESGVILNIPQ